ncbi:MAG TPA: serine protease [Bdellovibrionales bacterium]|nr:MAG: hypothetical protein A2Z97_14190 [Bdellovibrionales bacterium GWB1_52_6]OFZ03282.1 MAG: hypothetical protein A2X97_10185 [Bdellovibrionales bacterium GWA1_52_35]OFZ40172.1 MAG: hypothetical protein A2070_11785 [Bdellovibrionales bacterium GWC1_52_8]HAR43093.1 serine protease [Bdellovibrionales bacterium]HCM40532.1 serine protease [Bdellovibrionales bacterium]
MKLHKNISALSILTTLAVLSVSSANAGELLRFKSGDIRIDQVPMTTSTMKPYFLNKEKQGYFIVQFKNVITESTKADLAQMGLEAKGYLPDDALIVKGTARDAEAVVLLSDVRGVTRFAPEWKISSELYEMPANDTEVLAITVLDNSEIATIARQIKLTGASVRHMGRETIAARATRTQIAQIAEIEGIEWIQAYPLFTTFEYQLNAEPTPPTTPPALTGYESGTKVMNFDAAWARGFKGQGQMVGMADTGVDMGDISTIHPDLKAVSKGFALGFGAKSWEDTNGHGTHVCGSVIGNGAVLNGAIQGGAPAADMIVEGIWSPLMDNIMFDNDFNAFLGKAYKEGVRIHTNSWGSAQSPSAYDAFAMKADAYLWEHLDMLVLFAAGNDGKDLNKDGRIDEQSLASPATAKNVLTVGASENYLAEGGIQKAQGLLRDGDKKWGVEPLKSDTLSNNPNGMACFSSRGPTKDGRIKPDVVAPGTNIVSTRSSHPKAGVLWGAYGDRYAYAGGTSMATPLTAGAATVVREYLVKAKNIANPSAAVIKATLMHTAKDLFPGQYGRGPQQEQPTVRPNSHEGYGRVDMDQATALEDTLVIDENSGIAVNEDKSVSISVGSGKSLRATLVYTDAPGTALAAKALVNDLDLQVIAPNGTVNQLSDRANNAEMIEMKNLATGEYRIVVKGINVPQGKSGKQPYSLLITQF